MISWGVRTPARRILQAVVFAAAKTLTSFFDAIQWDLVNPKISSYWIGIGIKGKATVCDSMGIDSSPDKTVEILNIK